jgi:hypothetical protein
VPQYQVPPAVSISEYKQKGSSRFLVGNFLPGTAQ